MVTLIALVIAVAMKILGALLIDSLLVLPVLASSKLLSSWKYGTGMKKLFAASSIAGFIISFAGFILAVAFDLPPSAAVALVAGGVYLVFSFGGKR
jgi:zinc transport system permease protein